MKPSRRKILSEMGSLAMGGLALTVTPALAEATSPTKENKPKPELPWPYKKLDSDKAAVRAYKGYFAHRCMFGAFDAIIGELGDLYGQPYSSFPSTMMAYGAGGVAGWGITMRSA